MAKECLYEASLPFPVDAADSLARLLADDVWDLIPHLKFLQAKIPFFQIFFAALHYLQNFSNQTQYMDIFCGKKSQKIPFQFPRSGIAPQIGNPINGEEHGFRATTELFARWHSIRRKIQIIDSLS